MTRSILLLALTLAFTSCTLPSGASRSKDPMVLHSTLLVGARSIDHPQYDSHAPIGFEVDAKRSQQSLGYEIGASVGSESSTQNGLRQEGDFYEGYAGVRWHFMDASDRVVPFVSTGLSYLNADRETLIGGAVVAEAEDWSGGAYIRAGAYGTVGETTFDGGTKILLGGDVRAVFGDDYDWIQFSLMLGFSH